MRIVSGACVLLFSTLLAPRVSLGQTDSLGVHTDSLGVHTDHDDSSHIHMSIEHNPLTRKAQRSTFLITEMESPRQYSYRENFSMLDFNRVDGFFLGVGSSNMVDLGPKDEIGVNGGIGWSFEDKRLQYFLGSEYRIPLQAPATNQLDSTLAGKLFFVPQTIAIGAEFHNQTSTEDHWRARRMENAAYAFFAREDFRDYYKLAGWSAYLAYRPRANRELRIEWRNDKYEHRDQQVFGGRFGGRKVLPPNPHENPITNRITEGIFRALVLTYHGEGVVERANVGKNLLGDSIEIDELAGFSTLLQSEFGIKSETQRGFNRYILDVRSFRPITTGLAFDTRLRYEASTGDAPYQKLQALGGSGSLPGLRYKEMIGNRLLLLNTEVRLHLAALSAFFAAHEENTKGKSTPAGSDLQLVVMNDFGYVGRALNGEGIFEGFADLGLSTLAYNVGVALGHVSGIQVGAYWRTDKKDDTKFFFRLERPF